MSKTSSMDFTLGILTFSTGMFAIIGSLYSWGEGVIFTVNTPLLAAITADLFITGPLSFLLSYGIFKRKNWVPNMKWMMAGIYIYGSAVVYAHEFTKGAPVEIHMLILPLFGLILSGMLCFHDFDKISFKPKVDHISQEIPSM